MKEEWRIAFAGQPGRKSADRNSEIAIFQGALLIIPGIIAAVRYSQTMYLIAENDDLGPYEAIQRSSRMMDGYKAKYFLLALRYYALLLLISLAWMTTIMAILPHRDMVYSLMDNPAISWLLLLAFTIPGLFIQCFMEAAFARFYDDFKTPAQPEASQLGPAAPASIQAECPDLPGSEQ